MGQDRFDQMLVWMSPAEIERQIDATLAEQPHDSSQSPLRTARALGKLLKQSEGQSQRPPGEATCERILSWVKQVWDVDDRALVRELCQLIVLAPCKMSSAFLLVQSLHTTGELHQLIRHAADLAGHNYLLDATGSAPGRDAVGRQRRKLSLQLQSAPVTQRDLRQGTLLAIGLKAVLIYLLIQIIVQWFQGKPSDAVLVMIGAAGDFLLGLMQLTIVYYFVCHKYQQTIVDGFSLRLPTWTAMLLGVLLGVAFAALIIVLSLTVLKAAAQADPDIVGRATLWTGLLHVAASLWCALGTQVFHQGFMFPALRTRRSAVMTIIIVSLVFAWMTTGGAGRIKPTFLVLNFLRGTVSATQRHLTGSPWPAILTEWSFLLTMFTAYAVAKVLGI